MSFPATSVCPICGCTRAPDILIAKEMVLGTFEEFHYGLCSECGVLWLMDPPTDMSKYYANYYSLLAPGHALRQQSVGLAVRAFRILRGRQFHRLANALASRLLKILFRRKSYAINAICETDLSAFESSYESGFALNICAMFGLGLNPDSRILDYGSGAGQFVLEMSQLGFKNILGLDPFLENDIVFPTGAKAIRGDLCTLNPSAGVFDVITMHHSFEHIPNPFEIAQGVFSLLGPTGVLVLRFPHIGSYHFKKYRQNWWGIHAPRHYFIHSRKSLEIVFGKVGLEIFHVKCDSQYDHYLYSQEYELGISDNSSFSFRSGCGGIFTDSDIQYWKQKAKLLNRALVGDWIVYYLRHKQMSS